MVTITELKERKRKLCYTNKMVSDISGVPLSTVEKIFGGSTETPRYETLLKLENALFPADRELRVADPYYMPDGSIYRMHVQEPEPAYAYGSFYGYDTDYAYHGKKQGEYTVKDYLKIPDDIRMELIDGVLYDMGAPTTTHQTIILEVAMQIMPAIQASGGDCMVFLSPVDVQFEESDSSRDLLQPDLTIVCDKKKYQNENGRIMGAPDMVMEVLSPSSLGKDRVVKLNKYGEKGVREYWIVDPFKKEIHVFFINNKGFSPDRYTFDDNVPLQISGGKISVDFRPISDILQDRLGYDKGNGSR